MAAVVEVEATSEPLQCKPLVHNTNTKKSGLFLITRQPKKDICICRIRLHTLDINEYNRYERIETEQQNRAIHTSENKSRPK